VPKMESKNLGQRWSGTFGRGGWNRIASLSPGV